LWTKPSKQYRLLWEVLPVAASAVAALVAVIGGDILAPVARDGPVAIPLQIIVAVTGRQFVSAHPGSSFQVQIVPGVQVKINPQFREIHIPDYFNPVGVEPRGRGRAGLVGSIYHRPAAGQKG
jgi:hypothetical protein